MSSVTYHLCIESRPLRISSSQETSRHLARGWGRDISSLIEQDLVVKNSGPHKGILPKGKG